jgi:hypothetical protein
MDIQLDRYMDSAEGIKEEKVSAKEALIWKLLRAMATAFGIRYASPQVSTREELKWKLLLQKCLSKQTRVIVVSGHSTMERVKSAFKDYRVHDFFAKQTLKPEEFIRAVEEVLQKVGAVCSGGGESIRAKSLQKQLEEHKSNLNKLKEQKATFAKGEEPLRLLNQIEAEEKEIARLEAELREF